MKLQCQQKIKQYKITNLELTADMGGYNVHDYFDESPDDVRFATRSDAEEWLEDHYEGDDEDGIGVTWEIREEEIEITEWRCTDGMAEIDITADIAEMAAQEYVDGGEWGGGPTWVDVQCTPLYDGEPIIGAEGECVTITVEAEEPECEDGHEHDWCSPYELLGGLKENPGVYGHGGGVVITEVCSICGAYRITDTWAQRQDTGEQGLESVEYREADEESRAWCLFGIRDAISALSIEAMDISDGIYADADRICGEINEGAHSRGEAADLLEQLREDLEEALSEDD